LLFSASVQVEPVGAHCLMPLPPDVPEPDVPPDVLEPEVPEEAPPSPVLVPLVLPEQAARATSELAAVTTIPITMRVDAMRNLLGIKSEPRRITAQPLQPTIRSK